MRKPNGYGCIKRLSGNRRRPFVFVVSEDGRQKPVEYFTNQIDAEIFQADYNKFHRNHSLPGHQIILAELYHRWLPAHIADTAPSQSALDSYANSYRHLSSLQQEPITDLKFMDYQRIIDDMRKSGLSYSSLKKVRSLISLLEKYALKLEIINKSYAALLSIGKIRWSALTSLLAGRRLTDCGSTSTSQALIQCSSCYILACVSERCFSSKSLI